MFRIAKNLVKTLEQSVQETLAGGNNQQLDVFFQSIPPQLLLTQAEAFKEDHVRFNGMVSGLRVVAVEEHQLQLESFFDYIVGIEDQPIPLLGNAHGYYYPDYQQLIQLFNGRAGDSVKLNVWSAKGGTYREEYLSIRPKDENRMEEVSLTHMSDERGFESLGFKVQWSPLVAATYTYHILNITLEYGPASAAGLIPDEDYIIGCQDGLLATGGETLLQDVVRSRAHHDLVLYVYNKAHDCTRPLTVSIGPDGRLGCNVGYGFLHRIPAVKEVQEAQKYIPEPLSEDAFVPTQFTAATTVAAPEAPPASTDMAPETAATPLLPPQRSAHRKKHTSASPSTAGALGNYFDEGKDTSSRLKAADQQPPPTKSTANNV
ncbi:hypothetical protein ZYGM_003221 [Zygosaccharomyces mellis]|uniref:PDZ GRASP-type domain-containing protein n=1 Tax=Zygosaccharomyces mellis TaxID=42258 RepID=A0A4C2E7H6_9SACH|nr:hypothetical protein ZYGM_003221 [Zygosaccharomyces mellis]